MSVQRGSACCADDFPHLPGGDKGRLKQNSSAPHNIATQIMRGKGNIIQWKLTDTCGGPLLQPLNLELVLNTTYYYYGPFHFEQYSRLHLSAGSYHNILFYFRKHPISMHTKIPQCILAAFLFFSLITFLALLKAWI
jgi:hypothetical protein